MTIYNMTLSTTEPYNNVGAVTVRQDDNLTQKFVANIVENGTRKKDLSGYQVFFNALFDGNIIARDLAQYDYGENIATYTLRDSFFQQTGEVEAYFSFEKDGKRDSTANFSYYVTAGNCRNIRQGNYIYELEELLSVSDDIIKNKDFTVLLEENRKLNAKLEEVKSGFSVQVDELRKDFSRELAQTNKDVSEHESNKKNPHSVTASQVGAYSKEEAQAIARGETVFYSEKGIYLDEKQEITYDYNKMNIGIFLIWSNYQVGEGVVNSHFQTQVILREQLDEFAGYSSVFWVGPQAVSAGQKMVYAYKSRLKGRDQNAQGDNRIAVLRKVVVI